MAGEEDKFFYQKRKRKIRINSQITRLDQRCLHKYDDDDDNSNKKKLTCIITIIVIIIIFIHAMG